MLLLTMARLSSRHEQRAFIHTCLPLMNQKKSEEFDEQPHMRVAAKAAAKEKGLYFEESNVQSMRSLSRSRQLYDVS